MNISSLDYITIMTSITAIILGLYTLAYLHGSRIKAFATGLVKGFRRVEEPPKFKSDFAWMRENKCPICHAEDTLVGGPQGGMSQNVACSNCGNEFNVTPALGLVDRTGKLGDARARHVFGIDPTTFTA